ncbi:hypothetical protein FRC08_011830 [Ceratobasidium sp. 394]|nr:hypothetical protein FRC08_011830 [Ceratobasidium sp. 394]
MEARQLSTSVLRPTGLWLSLPPALMRIARLFAHLAGILQAGAAQLVARVARLPHAAGLDIIVTPIGWAGSGVAVMALRATRLARYGRQNSLGW